MRNLKYWKYCLIIVSLVLVSIQIQAQNGWTRVKDQPTHSAAASASVIDNKIYVIGGCDGAPNFNDLNVNEVYDPLSNTWDTTKLPMPTPRGWLYSGVVDGIIYAIGGGYPTATDKNEAYDPVTDTWTTKAPMIYPWCGVYGDVVNDRIYSVGGNYVHRNCFEFDPDSNRWTEKTPIHLGGCVGPLSATAHNGLIYTFGGATNYPIGPLSTVNAYNPQTDTWDTTLAHMPTPRYALRTFLVNDKIYAIGGSQARYTSLATVEVYDPATDTWDTTLTDMPEPLAWFAGAVVNNKIYVIGGTPDWASGNGWVWEYTPPIVDVEQEYTHPIGFALSQNYPNPFNPSTKISWQSPVGSWQTLKVYDILGNEVATLVDEYKPAGKYEVEFKAANLTSGLYFYQLSAGSFVETKKMLLLK